MIHVSIFFITSLRRLMTKTKKYSVDLVESVEKLYVRRREYDKAKELSDNFVKLPVVKKIDMYAEFAEFTPGI
jgi:hypothetical protein